MRLEKLVLREVGPFENVAITFPKGTANELADVCLLTGENGSGKSTILYAIAALVDPMVKLGGDLLTRRLRSPSSLVAGSLDDERLVLTRLPWNKSAEDPLGVGDHFMGSQMIRGVAPPLSVGWQASGTRMRTYSEDAALHVMGNRSKQFDWAAFSYAGLRTLERARLGAVKEPTESPFANSLSFERTAETLTFANWIASQEFKRLKAKESGNSRRVDQLERSVRDIEQIIAEITDDPTFQFVVDDSEIEVKARQNGTVLDLDLLPDGLKSIVSWVGDLLMRLDRVPWVGDAPARDRSFLLLLDEIDIHLHPSWQRKVLPIVQRMFPRAQVIASTHSPFVVTSAADAHIVSLHVRDGRSQVESTGDAQVGVSYSAVLRSIFGITSEFDVETEQQLRRFHDAKRRLFEDDPTAQAEIDAVVSQLATRSEELRELIGLELAQLNRQRGQRRAQ